MSKSSEKKLFEVCPYSIDKLKEIFSQCAYNATSEIINFKRHTKYFDNYFKDLAIKTIVVEKNYTDRDYLEDYAAYYARCFENYKRKCCRLHFFNITFTTRLFKYLIKNKSTIKRLEFFQLHYQGFIVVRPLPETFIGRTCLKTYPPTPNNRNYPATRAYHVNLFGIPLEVESVAFQEQDKTVSSCATSALWSVLQITGKTFQHVIPSPVEITKSAFSHYPTATRGFPNHGLRVEQMACAIRSVGLEPYLIDFKAKMSDPLDIVTHNDLLKSVLYAYVKGRIPGLFLFAIISEKNGEMKVRGFHATAITGFCLAGKLSSSVRFYQTAHKIDRIFVHDDQVGPFSRMMIDNSIIEYKNISGEISKGITIEGSHSNGIRVLPLNYLFPLYHKIRIPFEHVKEIIEWFNTILNILWDSPRSKIKPIIEWDIYLITNNDYKSEIRVNNRIDSDTKLEILSNELPHYLWRAVATINSVTVFEVIFDATDIEQGKNFIRCVVHNVALATYIASVNESQIRLGLDFYITSILKKKKVPRLKLFTAWSIYEWFIKSYRPFLQN